MNSERNSDRIDPVVGGNAVVTPTF